jgi:hypothetical protein
MQSFFSRGTSSLEYYNGSKVAMNKEHQLIVTNSKSGSNREKKDFSKFQGWGERI